MEPRTRDGFARPWIAVALAVAAAVAATAIAAAPARSRAAAAEAPHRAAVVAIDGADVFVDLGTDGGAIAGDEVVVYRVVEARNPRSGRALKDRFRIGTMPLAQAGAVLSLARPDPALAPLLSVGDEVELAPRSRPRPSGTAGAAGPPLSLGAPTAPAGGAVPATGATGALPSGPGGPGPPDGSTGSAPSGPGPGGEVMTAAGTGRDEIGPLRLAWTRTFDLPARERALAWEAFVEAHPDSPFVELARREALALHQQAELDDQVLAGPPRLEGTVQGGSPFDVDEGHAVEVALLVPDDARIAKARVHYRPAGGATYRSAALALDGDGYLRGVIPAEAVKQPGLEWFASATDEAERERTLSGNGPSPNHVVVGEDPTAPPVRVDRSRIGVFAEHVSFDGLGGDDRYTLIESDFLYRVLTTLYSVKLGFGVYQGTGGSNEELDAGSSRDVGLNYGYSELELRLADGFAVIGKGLAGNATDGFAAGVESKVRIGRERGTSLVLGASTTSSIGDAGSLQLNWDTVRSFPMSGTVVVTNMPVGEDLRIRLVYELRHPLGEVVELAARASYGARDAEHGGFGFGLGTVYHW